MDNNSNNKLSIFALVAAAISLAVSIYALTAKPQASTPAEATDTATETVATAPEGMFTENQYVLYVGTNDKDTYKMEMSKEEAHDRVNDILLEHFGGYTLSEASGYWLDDQGNPTSEYTLVCTLDEPDVDEVYAACEEIREALNQNTVLVEHDTIDMQYYAGSDSE